MLRPDKPSCCHTDVLVLIQHHLTSQSILSTCRAAFMCGREPNFELTEEEKKELDTYTWEDFLTITRNTITNKSKIHSGGIVLAHRSRYSHCGKII